MKMKNTMLAITLFALAGCGGSAAPPAGDVITIDVTADYPKKELILQDFMDVEYIPLETADDFLCQGFVQAIGRELVVVTNRISDGDIFIFDRSGKALRKINRKGPGSEEYTHVQSIILDEDSGEMFINDPFAKKITVYDTYGNFRRSFRYREDAMNCRAYVFDRENLICHVELFRNAEAANKPEFMIISKQDGSVAREIQIPYKEKKTTMLTVHTRPDGTRLATGLAGCPLIPFPDCWILTELSSDTVYAYSLDHTMTPFMARTPSIQSMEPEVFLFPGILTDRYWFTEAIKKTYDAATRQGFPRKSLMYDRREKAFFEYTVYNDDYSDKKQVSMQSIPLSLEITTWQTLEAHLLVEDYNAGQLKGRLKDAAAGLDEESNPVIMLIKRRKN
jgi:hypothetical protein